MIVLTLDRIDFAARVEAKHFVAEIQAIPEDAQALVEAIAALHVELRVSIKINVATGPLQPLNRIIGRPVRLVRILEKVGVIVSNRKSPRESRLVISQPNVPIVRRLALQSWMIIAPVGEVCRKGDLRSGVTIVRRHPESIQKSRKPRQPLFPCRFESGDMGVGTIDGLRQQKSRLRTRRQRKCGRINRIGQLFIEKSRLQNSQRLEEMLDEQIIIVGLGGLQVRVACLNLLWTRVRIDNGRRNQVPNIWPRDSLAEVGA